MTVTGQVQLNPSTINAIHQAIPKIGTIPNVLYHYTSVKVLESILNKAQFWASNIFYLNDAEEYYNGIAHILNCFAQEEYDQLKTQINSVRSENGYSSEGVFSISFSGFDDNLHQWITYSKEAGVCLCVDCAILLNSLIVYENTEKHNLVYADCRDVLSKAFYGGDDPASPQEILSKIYNIYKDQESVHFYKRINPFPPSSPSSNVDITTILNEIDKLPAMAKAYFRLYASYWKNEAFQIENEYRIALLPSFAKHSIASAKIDYVILSSGVIRPYIKAGFRHPDIKQEIAPLPIKAITIGPAVNQQAVFDSVVHRIKYGKSMVWDYWKKRDENNAADPFWENFISYVCGAVERFAHKNARSITRNELISVSEKLWSIWREENRVAFVKKPTDLENRIIEKFKKTQPNLDQLSKPDRHMEILASITRDNYFTKEGIWIKKSQIAYVF